MMRAMRVALLLACSTLFACVGDETVAALKSDAGPSTTGDAGDAGTDAGGLPATKLVFVASQPQSASQLKDLAQVCTTDLNRHRKGSAFAWAQDKDGKSPVDRLGAYAGPWTLPSGKVVFATKADITGGAGAATPINETLEGTVVTDGHVWTALEKAGTPKPNNCRGWDDKLSATTGSTIGVAGLAWADDGTILPCKDTNRIICFEN